MNHATCRQILELRPWEPQRSKLATLGGLLEFMLCALQSALSVDCPNRCFALFGLSYPRNEQTIHGLLHKAWIHALHSYIHELSESMLCAQQTHPNTCVPTQHMNTPQYMSTNTACEYNTIHEHQHSIVNTYIVLCIQSMCTVE